MILNVKLLDGTTFPVEVDPEISLTDLKNVIESFRSDLPASAQVLIYNGKVLRDTGSVAESEIQENTFVVCMVKKKGGATPAPTTNPSTVRVPTQTPSVPAPIQETTPVIPVSQPQPQPQPHQSHHSNEATNAVVQQLSGMGFPETEARLALQAANGNPDLAIEYLFNGIPESYFHSNRHHHHHYQVQEEPQDVSPVSTIPTIIPPQGRPLEILRRHPQINTLRAIFQQDPSSITAVLQQIGASSPELLQLIHQNRDEFLRVLSEPIPNFPLHPQVQQQGSGITKESFLENFNLMSQEVQQETAQLFGFTADQLLSLVNAMPSEEFERFVSPIIGGSNTSEENPGHQIVRLNDEEMESITRLMELGFSQNDAVQAFLACDKNEEMAANLLYDTPYDSYPQNNTPQSDNNNQSTNQNTQNNDDKPTDETPEDHQDNNTSG